jgi:hypothetical protein
MCFLGPSCVTTIRCARQMPVLQLQPSRTNAENRDFARLLHQVGSRDRTRLSLFRQHAERGQAMCYSISTLLSRNLHDVFGENDPARRRAAIDEIFTEDCVFYESRASTMGATRSIASRARSKLLTLTFDISQLVSRRNWTIAAGSNGCRAALVRHQLTPGLISSLHWTARFPPFISFSTSYPKGGLRLRRAQSGARGSRGCRLQELLTNLLAAKTAPRQ